MSVEWHSINRALKLIVKKKVPQKLLKDNYGDLYQIICKSFEGVEQDVSLSKMRNLYLRVRIKASAK